MAWRRPGYKPLSEAMMVNLLTHICVTRPQWVDEMDRCNIMNRWWNTTTWAVMSDLSKRAVIFTYSGADMWIWRALSEESMKFGTWGFWGMLKPKIAGTMMPDEGFMPKMRNSRWPPQNLRFIITRLVYVRFVWFWGLIVCFRGQGIQWNT